MLQNHWRPTCVSAPLWGNFKRAVIPRTRPRGVGKYTEREWSTEKWGNGNVGRNIVFGHNSAADKPRQICVKFCGGKHNRMLTNIVWHKWYISVRIADILKVIRSFYLCKKSPILIKFGAPKQTIDSDNSQHSAGQNSKFCKFKMADGRHVEKLLP